MSSSKRLALLLGLVLFVAAPAAADTLVCIPASNVDTSDWTPTAGAVWENLEESALADLSTNDGNGSVATNASGFNVFLITQRDTGTCNVPGGATSISVDAAIMARHASGANCSIRLRMSGTNYEDFGAAAVGTSFGLMTDAFPTNPDAGGAAWSVATANAIEGFGARCEDGVVVTAMVLVYTYTPGAGSSAPTGLTMGVGEAKH